MAAEKPNVFKRLAKATIDFLNRIIASAKVALPGFESDQFFKDTVVARDVAKYALADYADQYQKGLASGKASGVELKHGIPKRSHTNKNAVKNQSPKATRYAEENTAGLQSTGVPGLVPTGQHSESGPQPRKVTKETLDTRLFRRWFGRSRLSDESGNPLEFFHGSATFKIDNTSP